MHRAATVGSVSTAIVPPPRRTSVDWPLAQTISAMILCVAIAYRWSTLKSTDFWVDIDVYLRGANAVIHGEDLYSVAVHGLKFTYSPFAAVVFTPFTVLPASVHRVLFTALSLAAYVFVIWAVARRLSLRPATVLVIGLGGLATEPFLRTIQLGQINLILIAMVVLDVLLLRSTRRGYLVGIAAGIKIVPGIFILYFALKRDWRSMRHSAVGFVASVAVGGMVAPGETRQYWSGGFLTMDKFGETAVAGVDNQSLSAALMRGLHLSPLPTALTVLSCVVGVALGVAVASWQLRRGDDAAAATALAIGGLLGSPVSWSHHWVWVIVILLLLAHRRAWLSVWLLGALFWVGPFWTLRNAKIPELGLSVGQQVIGGCYVLAGLGLLALLSRRGPATGPEQAATSPLDARMASSQGVEDAIALPL